MAYLYIGDQKVSPVLTRDYQVSTISGTTPTINLNEYTVYTAEEELTSLTIINPVSIANDFIAQINFVSGSIPTVINSTDIEWFGDNVNGAIPVLRADCSYTIMFYYTGTTLRGIIQGSSIL